VLTGNSHIVTALLPLGISFHTFQSISYVVEVYRGEQKAIRNPIDYALFIAFFPQLVAGPIVRARDFFANLFHWRPPSASEVQEAAMLVLTGLVKKFVLADHFALVADPYFSHVTAHPGMLQAWTAALAFAMQIFFDFSGYTDIAIGCALLFGFHFPVNFRRPYLATGIADFWRRWHISLSQWLRDFLYLPLGGSRHGRWMTYRNLAITMLLGGLWHGASWNFVIWGAYHGALLGVERATRPFGRPVTFLVVLMGWVFFRTPTLGDSGFVFRQMFAGARGESLLSKEMLLTIALVAAIAVLEERFQIFERISTGSAWIQAPAMAVLLVTLELFGVFGTTIPFVYFQF
jgi:alginate O-acetyltransferase complex protein AlgI